MRKFFTLLLVFLSAGAYATHIVGGFISYRFISGTTYEVKLTIYRDCTSSTPFDGTPGSTTNAILGLFDSNNNLVNTFGLVNPVITTVQAPTDNPCLQINTNVCVEEGVYTTTITLPSSTQGYTLVHERCCRNGSITNVFDPGNQGAAYAAYIPPTGTFHNTSPVFNTLPPLFICISSPLVLNYSASDADGDVLTYSLCTPYNGGDVTNPAPNPPVGPPLSNIPWQSPYSTSNLLGGTSPLSIDPNTGVITGTPSTIGQFVVGVCVSEYRNGQLIATYLRDFQFNVTQCNIPAANIPSTNINPITGVGIYVTNCSNYTVTFQNNTYNPPPTNSPITYHWDFGVPGLTDDTSNVKFPTYTYPDTGVYLVQLVASKGTSTQPCVDTTYAYVKIYPTFSGDFQTADVCQSVPASFTDLSVSTLGAINQWSWNFGDGNTDNTQNPTHNYSTPGAYTVTLVSQTDLGCKDTTQKGITILASAHADFSFSDPVCESSSVHFINNSTPSSADFNWNLGNSTSSTTASPTVSYAPGTYQIKLLVTMGGNCPDSLSKPLTVHPDPVINISNDTAVCPGASVPLAAHDGTSYVWSPTLGLSDPNIANPVASPAAPNAATYSVTVTNQFQCTATGSVTVSFYAPAQVSAGIDTSVCLNPGSYRDSVQLTASGSLNYLWSPAISLNNAAIANPVARPSANTTYVVIGTDVNGCRASDSVIIYVLDPMLNVIIDNEEGICPGDTAYLNVVNQGASDYSWSPTNYMTDVTVFNPGFYPPDTTLYVLRVSNYCYTKNDSVVINIWPLPSMILEDADSICYGQAKQLNVSGAQSYLWDADPALTNTATATPTVVPTVSTFYFVTGTNNYGCVNRDSIWVEAMPLPYTEAGNDTVIWRETPAVLSGVTDAGSFFWNPETGLESPKLLTTTANILSTQVYYLYTTSDFGCSNYDSIVVNVKTVTILNLPTAFSPNGDGINDVFHIINWLNIDRLKDFSVYNRWGEKVFSTADIYEGWDGTFRNTKQPMSTYVWLVTALSKDGVEILRKGNVTLVR